MKSYPFKAQHLISNFTPYFTPKIPHLRVHYINQHITINQSITKIAKVPKHAFLQKTAQNSPFYPLSKTAISSKAQVVIVSSFYFLVSMTKIEKPAAETFVSLSSKAWNKSFIQGNLCSISMKLKFQGKGLSETLVSSIIQIWNIWKFTCKPLLIPSRYDPSTYRLFYHKSHTLYLFVRGVSKSPCPRAWRGAAKEQALSIRCLYDWL